MNLSNLARLIPVAVLALSAACATAPDEPTSISTGQGGKADGPTDPSAAVALTPMPAADQDYLRAADAECLHIQHTGAPYNVSIKMFCMANGGVVAPYRTYVAAVSEGESGAVYEVFEIPAWSSHLPENVAFQMDGNTGTLTYDLARPADIDAPDIQYVTHTATAKITFEGPDYQPAVGVTFAEN